MDGAHIGGDLLTAAAITAGGGAHQHPIGVAQGQGIAIDLELADVLALKLRAVLQLAPQASIPGLQFFGVEGVIEAEHANAVLNACEPLSGRAAYPLGGAVSTQQLGVLLLKVQQLPVEPVVNGIFEFRCIEHVIGVGSPVQ